MPQSFTVAGLSYFEASIHDVVLQEERDIRLVFRPRLVRHDDAPHAKLKGRLVRQRRHSRSSDWEDFDSFNPLTMKGGQEVQIYLNADTLFSLHEELKRLYELPVDWSTNTSKEYVAVEKGAHYIASGREKAVIEQMLGTNGTELWDWLEELGPGLIETIALQKQHARRCAAVEEFEEHIAADDWNESHWQSFFERNEWIFGHNLLFQFLSVLSNQGHVGGATMTGRGGQRTDMIVRTEATARFTVLVDIKKPDSELLERHLYRNKVHQIGSEVVGGTSQLQSYCRTWVTEGVRVEENAEQLRIEDVSTYEPRAILVVGHLKQLDDMHKRATFEMFRRNLRNPEIITYDELLARAKFTVEVEEREDSQP